MRISDQKHTVYRHIGKIHEHKLLQNLDVVYFNFVANSMCFLAFDSNQLFVNLVSTRIRILYISRNINIVDHTFSFYKAFVKVRNSGQYFYNCHIFMLLNLSNNTDVFKN